MKSGVFGGGRVLSLALALGFVPQLASGQQNEIDVFQDSSGFVYVEFVAEAWFAYELQESDDLETWASSGVTTYGFGQTVTAFVFDTALAQSGGGSEPPDPPEGQRFFLRPFNDGTTLVSWTDENGTATEVLDATDFTGGSAQVFSLEIEDDDPPHTVLYTVLVTIAPTTTPPKEYSYLPAGSGATWAQFTGARDEILAAIANPPAGGAQENAGNSASADGLSRFFRVAKIRNDFDGDGLFDDEEAVLGTGAFDNDSDGDGFSDRYEHEEGEDPLSGGSQPAPVVRFRSARRWVDYDYYDYSYGSYSGSSSGDLLSYASWVYDPQNGGEHEHQQLPGPVPFPSLAPDLANLYDFPDRIPRAGLTDYEPPTSVVVEGDSAVVPDPPHHRADLEAKRLWLEIQPDSGTAERRSFLKVTRRWLNGNEVSPDVEVAEVEVPAGGHLSGALDVAPSFSVPGPANAAFTEFVSTTLTAVKIETETAALLPANRARRTIGVGEVVNLELIFGNPLPAGTTWTWSLEPATGGGELEVNPTNPNKAKYLAPAVAATPEIKVTFAPGGPLSVHLQVIEPNGIRFVSNNLEGHGVYINGAGNPGKSIGMRLNPAFFLLPDTVNFDNLRTYEGAAAPVRAGYFLQRPYPDHDANGPHRNSVYVAGQGNRGNAHNNAGFDYDRFEVGTDGPLHGSGTITWTCDWDYEVFRDGAVVGAKRTFAAAPMDLELVKAGNSITATISKGAGTGQHSYSQTFTLAQLGE